jgi:ATP-binding cassette subfamily C protein
MTIVTIAHRPSMVSFADYVIAINAGQVVECGRFAELASRRNGLLSTFMRSEAAEGWQMPEPKAGIL